MVFSKIIKKARAARTDFSVEFKALEAIYYGNRKKAGRLKEKEQLLSKLIKGCMTLLLSVVAYKLIPKNSDLRLTVSGAVTFFGGIFTISPYSLIKRNSEQIGKLDSELEKVYKCPKCDIPLPIKDNWHYYAGKTKCDKCKAIWVK